ncbi:MAG: PEP-CTERM sorting domain-containing protein [Candidatus Nealsonbacteria bacterium]|nr:PEP-CTERM sorting domain-containing protein [Candidatus Nealsonbacteria bacterium]
MIRLTSYLAVVVVLLGGGHLAAGPVLWNVEDAESSGPDLVVSTNATITSSSDVEVLGDLTVLDGVTSLVFDQAVYMMNNATIADGVTIDGEWEVGGTLSIADAVGTLTIGEGELVFGSGATYNAEVGLGDGSVIEADRIVIGGYNSAIHIDATLKPKGVGRTDANFWANATPTIVDNTAGGVLTGVDGPTGFEFAAVDPTPAGGDSAHIGQGVFLRGVRYQSLFGFITWSVELDVFIAIGGDADGDATVWQSDFDVLDAHFSRTGSGMTWTDGNFDPWVDDKVWLSDWGQLRKRFAEQDYTIGDADAPIAAPAVEEEAAAAASPDDRVKLIVRLDLADQNGAPVQLVGHDVSAMTTLQINSPGGHLIPGPDGASAPLEMFLGQSTVNDIVIASLYSEIEFGPGEQTIDLALRVAVDSDDLNGVWMNPAAEQIPYAVEYVQVPEPGTIAMLLAGLAGLAVIGWRWRAA